MVSGTVGAAHRRSRRLQPFSWLPEGVRRRASRADSAAVNHSRRLRLPCGRTGKRSAGTGKFAEIRTEKTDGLQGVYLSRMLFELRCAEGDQEADAPRPRITRLAACSLASATSSRLEGDEARTSGLPLSCRWRCSSARRSLCAIEDSSGATQYFEHRRIVVDALSPSSFSASVMT
jgi:hypothetical protein